MAGKLFKSSISTAVSALFMSAFVVVTDYAATPAHGSETEKPKNLIAEQLRRQGFKCENPQSAERDEAASKPDAAVWILTCENASYRVKLIPDLAAEVTQLD